MLLGPYALVIVLTIVGALLLIIDSLASRGCSRCGRFLAECMLFVCVTVCLFM